MKNPSLLPSEAHAPRDVLPAGGPDPDAFEFVTELASELSWGKIDLPGIPDVALRVRKALEDDNVSAEQLERIVGAEPVLAGRLVQLANSAALNSSGRRVADLHTAITRTGFAMVRTTAIAYAISQLRNHKELKDLEQPLSVLWKRCTLVAAMCRAIAPRISQVSPDAAMLAGLLHGVGELYILTRVKRHEKLFKNDAAYRSVVRDWHASVAKAILENWELDETIVNAVGEFEQFEREHDGPVDITDVLTVGYLLAAYHEHSSTLELNMSDVSVCRRLGLGLADYETLIRESRDEVNALRDALHG
jgi:HD-like signal output (HDOD) protein